MAGAGFDPAAALEELEGTLASAREHVKRGRLEVPIDPPTKWALEALANMANSVEAARRLIVEIVHRTMCACVRPGRPPVALDCPVHGRPLQVREIDAEEATAQMRHAHGRGREVCGAMIAEAHRHEAPIADITAPNPPDELAEMGLSQTWFRGFCERLDEELGREADRATVFEVGDPVTIARGPIIEQTGPLEGVVVKPAAAAGTIDRGRVHVKAVNGTWAVAPSDLDRRQPDSGTKPESDRNHSATVEFGRDEEPVHPSLRAVVDPQLRAAPGDAPVSRETPDVKLMEWAERGRSDASEAIARCREAGGRIETLLPSIDETVGDPEHHDAYRRAFDERVAQEVRADLSARLREIAAGRALRPVDRGPDRVWAIDDPPEFLIEAFDLAVGAKVEKELIDLRRAFSVWLVEMNRAFTTVATAVSERAAGNRLGDSAHQALGALSALLRLETGHVEADEDEIAAATVTVRKSLMPGGRG